MTTVIKVLDGPTTNRINRTIDPDLQLGLTYWAVAGGALTADVGRGKLMYTLAQAAGAIPAYEKNLNAAATDGTIVSAAYLVTNGAAIPKSFRLRIVAYNGATQTGSVYGPSVVIAPGQTRTVYVDGFTVPTGSPSGVRSLLVCDTASAIGDVLYISKATTEFAAVHGTPFSGSSTDTPYTEYFWNSAPNTTTSTAATVIATDVVTPVLMDGYTMGRASGNRLTDIPGREDPIVATNAARSRAGQLKFTIGPDEAVAVALDTLLARPVTFVLADTDRAIVGMNFVLDVSGYQIILDDETRAVWTATVNVREVDA